jgi:hypothetical protein
MSLRSRLKLLEARAPDLWPDPPDNYLEALKAEISILEAEEGEGGA